MALCPGLNWLVTGARGANLKVLMLMIDQFQPPISVATDTRDKTVNSSQNIQKRELIYCPVIRPIDQFAECLE